MTTTKTIPVSLTEKLIEKKFETNPNTRERVPDDLLEGMVDAVTTAREAAEQAQGDVVAIMGNVMQTRSKNLKDADKAVMAHYERAAKKLDASRDRAERAILENREANRHTERADDCCGNDARN